jgi:hypothetical protein
MDPSSPPFQCPYLYCTQAHHNSDQRTNDQLHPPSMHIYSQVTQNCTNHLVLRSLIFSYRLSLHPILKTHSSILHQICNILWPLLWRPLPPKRLATLSVPVIFCQSLPHSFQSYRNGLIRLSSMPPHTAPPPYIPEQLSDVYTAQPYAEVTPDIHSSSLIVVSAHDAATWIYLYVNSDLSL